MSDDRNYIERMQEEAKLRYGRSLTPDEAAAKFAEHKLDARINHLKTLRDDGETLSIHKAAERLTFERKLRDVHNALRKVGR